jgi:hypothetical protein
MLNEEVVSACQAGTFEVYVVDTIEDALKITTRRFWDKGDNALKPAIMATLEKFQDIRTHKASVDVDDAFASWKSMPLRRSKKDEPSSAVPIE